MDAGGPAELVLHFDAPPDLSPGQLTERLGGKGAGLVRMTALGLPVPPGFVIPTDVCNQVLATGWFPELDGAIDAGIAELERRRDRRLGDPARPLLVSVRSGAAVSMPGMMDTVLNAGMTDAVAEALSALADDPTFGEDTRRRFVESYTTVVGPEVPADPRDQIKEAVKAVFASWNSERARVYRRVEGIDDHLGTAATIQTMVFGNLSDDSGTGVAFTRDPATGTPGLMGDFLRRAQGEDVVAGTHQTQPIADLEATWPEIAHQLRDIAAALEHELGDMVDMEFTVEDRTLWMLQARVGKRSPRAALRVAVAMANDPGFPVDRSEALRRVAHLLDDPPTESAVGVHSDAEVLVTGLAASPGRASGAVSVDVDDTVERAARGESVILFRPETSPADVHGMADAVGLVTTLGGLVSHAAVVARSWGKPAVVGAGELRIESDGVVCGTRRIGVGETVTVDGDNGEVLVGAHVADGATMPEVAVLKAWRDAVEPARATRPAGMAEAGEDEIRRLLMLKGMADAASLAEITDTPEDDIARVLDALAAAGHTQALPGDRLRLTPEGTTLAEDAMAADGEVAGATIEALLDRFHDLNQGFKEVITGWQTREVDGETVMNDHTDEAHDTAILDRLRQDIHPGIGGIVDEVAVVLPRFAGYRRRLAAALAAIDDGDTQMIAHPLRSSYHTVWFELHEELIRLSGRNRADEAKAGRGA